MKNEVTIVTAFLDIGRGSWTNFNRKNSFYFENFRLMTNCENDIIVFTEDRFFDEIRSMRKNIKMVSISGILEEYKPLLYSIEKIQKSEKFKSFVKNKSLPEYTNANYVFINYMKSYFLKTAVRKNLVETDVSAWLDFGYVRNPSLCPKGSILRFNPNDKINLFTVGNENLNFSYEQIKEIVRTNSVKIHGCHMIGPNNLWDWLFEEITFNLNRLIEDNMVDDDQTLLLMSYINHPEKFNLIKGSHQWFTLFIDKEVV